MMINIHIKIINRNLNPNYTFLRKSILKPFFKIDKFGSVRINSSYATINIRNNNQRPPSRLRIITEKAIEYGRFSVYAIIILGAASLGGMILYNLALELLDVNGIHSLYDQACSKLFSDIDILYALGEPVKAYNDLQTSRGHQRRPSTMILKEGNQERMKMQFFLIGTKDHAVVDAQFIQDPQTRQWKEYSIFVASPNGFRKFVLPPPREPFSLKNTLFGWFFGTFFSSNNNNDNDKGQNDEQWPLWSKATL